MAGSHGEIWKNLLGYIDKGEKEVCLKRGASKKPTRSQNNENRPKPLGASTRGGEQRIMGTIPEPKEDSIPRGGKRAK